MTSYRVRYVRPADPRLGRHVNHDPRSRRFAARAAGRPLESVQHERHAPVFDQGDTGSCTGNAAVGCMATGPFFDTVPPAMRAMFSEAGAVDVYGSATRIDPFDGEYPPTDTGSDGLSVAKVLAARNLISGYTHAFSLADALAGLMLTPFITGVEWRDGMFTPDGEGIVHPTGAVAGGHEFVGDGYDDVRGLVWFTNSWGDGWGKGGRFALPAEEFGDLLARDGDVTFFVPATEPAPIPVPDPADPGAGVHVDDADRALAAAAGEWARKLRPSQCLKARAAVRTWLDAKGL